MFSIRQIDDKIFARINGKSYKRNNIIPINDLRYISVLYRNLRGEILQGEMVCNKLIAEAVLDILHGLYMAEYPIERMELIDNYDADDEASMSANNSSCFNFRFISHTNMVSKHGLGLAVDINPLYNPYIKPLGGKINIEPAGGREYVDRTRRFPYKIVADDLCCRLFSEKGFLWGGDWKGKKDYQHFEVSDEFIRQYYPKY